MPWCPICRNEYKEGYTHCNDCDMDLVPSLEEGPVKIMYGMKEQIEQFHDYLVEKGFTGTFVRFNPEDKNHDLYVLGTQAGAASMEIRQLIQMQTQAHEEELMELAEEEYRAQLDENEQFDREEFQEVMKQRREQAMTQPRRRQAVVKKPTVYVDKKHKAEEYKSSAFSLILVGIAGIVLLVLMYMGVLPVHFAGASKVMITTVMGALFLLFLVMGFTSFGSYKKYLVIADEEAALIAEINKYLEENANKSQIDNMVKEKAKQLQSEDEDAGDEAGAYFMRMRMIRSVLDAKYSEEDELLIDHLAEEWYGSIYEN